MEGAPQDMQFQSAGRDGTHCHQQTVGAIDLRKQAQEQEGIDDDEGFGSLHEDMPDNEGRKGCKGKGKGKGPGSWDKEASRSFESSRTPRGP